MLNLTCSPTFESPHFDCVQCQMESSEKVGWINITTHFSFMQTHEFTYWSNDNLSKMNHVVLYSTGNIRILTQTAFFLVYFIVSVNFSITLNFDYVFYRCISTNNLHSPTTYSANSSSSTRVGGSSSKYHWEFFMRLEFNIKMIKSPSSSLICVS